ncbi:MAG: hypothetical protein J6Q94_03220 [Clostridia bacterium]|nr:hypothetical protein [Clostridia bacterium]
MAKRMKDFQIFRCPFCNCEYYDSTAKKGKNIGNPMMECPSCGKLSYRSSILEPALIGGNRYFNIRYASLYSNLRIVLILIYAVFLFFILTSKNFTIAIYLVVAAAFLYMLYEIIRICHRNSFLGSDKYDVEISESLERLDDEEYAQMIIRMQGIEEDSVYYYEMHQE